MIAPGVAINDTDSVKRVGDHYPDTRYMGSKQRLVPFLFDVLADLEFNTALDAMSGSGVVAYLLKAMGKRVTANDYLQFCSHIARTAVENADVRLDTDTVAMLCAPNPHADDFVQRLFRGLYFGDEDNRFLDWFAANLAGVSNPHERSLALAAVSRACLKARPRGVFTYTGMRYDDGRRDLRLSLESHFKEAVAAWNGAVFDNGRPNKALCGDIFEHDASAYDLVYVDPPYVSPHSDNGYSRRYHFVEGLMSYWRDVEIQHHTKTKKFVNRPTPFSSKRTVAAAFDRLFAQFPKSVLVVSYSSSGIPSQDQIVEIMRRHRKNVEVHQIDHSYTFGTHSGKEGNENNRVQEYVFVGR